MAGQPYPGCPVSPTGRRFNWSSHRRGKATTPRKGCFVSLRVLSARVKLRLASLPEKTSEPASQGIELISSLPSVIFCETPSSIRRDSHATWRGCCTSSWSGLVRSLWGIDQGDGLGAKMLQRIPAPEMWPETYRGRRASRPERPGRPPAPSDHAVRPRSRTQLRPFRDGLSRIARAIAGPSVRR
jgi:hypothetical protein